MSLTKLVRREGGSAIELDPSLVAHMQIDENTELKVTLEGRRLVIEPVDSRREHVGAVIERTGAKNAELFRRLAQ